MKPTSPLLQLQDIHLVHNELTILENISLQVQKNQIVTIIGPNGAGKTTLLKIILGLLSPTSGMITKRPKLRMGYMPQRLKINPTLPITVSRFLQLAGPVTHTTLTSVLEDVGAQRLWDRSMHVLSGGELQRVLLARALLGQPDLLVLDEPVQGVDVSGQKSLYRLIVQLKQRWNCSVLLVSHDLHLVLAGSDQVICLNQHICCAGKPEGVVKDPAYTQLFGPELAEHLAIYPHKHDHRHDEALDD